MAELSSVEKHYMDRAFQSKFALWSALLTINGIMISAFSLLRLIVPNVNAIVVVLLVGSCAISMLLLVLNFLMTKQHYLETGRRLIRQDAVDLNDKRMAIKIAIRKHHNTERRERAVLILLIVEIGLVIILMALAG